MKKLIHIDDHSSELRCDAPTCDYVAPRGEHTFGPHLIGLPCPKCGANLLTQQDYDLQKKILGMVDVVNRIGDMLGLGTETLPKNAPNVVAVGVRAVGGKVEIRER